MVKWINLILIISLFISCNSVNLAKYKSKNEAKSSFAIEKNTTISKELNDKKMVLLNLYNEINKRINELEKKD